MAEDAGASDARPPSDAGDAADAPPDSGCDSGDPSIQCLAAILPQGIAGALAVDDANIYWGALPTGLDGDPSNSQVMRLPRGGGPSVALNLGLPLSLASDGVNLYEAGDSEAIVRIPVGGGTPVTIAQLGSAVGCLALDDDNVYFKDLDNHIQSVPKAGGVPPTVLATAVSSFNELSIVVDETNVYWIAVGSPDLDDDATLMSVSKTGGQPVSLASVTLLDDPPIFCRLLARHGSSIFLMGSSETAVVSTNDAAAPTVLVTPTSSAGQLAIGASSTTLFWLGDAFLTPTVIDALSFDGGSPVVWATLPAQYIAPVSGDFVVADDGTLYWTSFNKVLSLAP